MILYNKIFTLSFTWFVAFTAFLPTMLAFGTKLFVQRIQQVITVNVIGFAFRCIEGTAGKVQPQAGSRVVMQCQSSKVGVKEILFLSFIKYPQLVL